ncbi:MAG: ABC transporter ATP-binding protein [Thiolinea sp.]
MTELQLCDVSVTFGETEAAKNITLLVEHGQLACLLGPSGCGKTTLLRAIAGFEELSSGTIRLGAETISATRFNVPPEKRNVGMVFQDFALFPHLDIASNIAFGIRKQSAKVRRNRVSELLELVNLPGYEKRYPHELSGGQQQRIALARALAPKPGLLLLDEPFASQDMALREMLAREVRQILQQEKVTAMLVTHDQHEAFAMADVIGVMEQGQIRQWDTAYKLYHQPVNQFVADFIGEGSILAGEVIDRQTVSTALGKASGRVPPTCVPGSPVSVLIRPDDVIIVPDEAEQEVTPATIVTRVFRGAHFLYGLTLADGTRISALAPSHQNYALEERVFFRLDMRHLVILQRAA